MRLTPKNWREFQHYKDRNPPWIRLHRGLIDNKDFNAMPAMACKVLVLLWLLASENTEGVFDDDADDLAFRLRLPLKDVQQSLATLKQRGFLVTADSVIEPEQDGRPLSKQIAEANGFGSRHISDKVKRSVWERDGGKCCGCGSADDIEFDHVHPVSKGGNSNEGNVQLLCRPCNRKKRTKTVEQLATPAQPTADQVATQAQPWLELRTSETETETETEQIQRQKQSRGRTSPAAGKPATVAPTAEAWTAYADAYETRYGAKPVRNASVNGQMAQVVAKLGADEAPGVARFYVGHQGGLYVSAMHPVNLLLRDAEKLRTEWATGRMVTRTQGALADKTQTNLNAFAPLIAEARAKEAEHAQRSAA